MEKDNYEQTISEIRELVKKCDSYRALSICKKPEYRDVDIIQAEKMYILNRKLNDADGAYKIWVKFKDSNNINVVVNGIDILMKLNRVDEALEYANQHRFDEIRYIRIRMKLLLTLGNYKEMEEIAKDTRYALDEVVQRIYNKVEDKLAVNKNKEEDISNDLEGNDLTTIILTRIYVDNITSDEIKNSNLDFYPLSILLLAYYDKHNRKKGIELVKKIKKNNISEKYRKVYNSIEQRLLSNKNNYFDITVYTRLLDRHIDFDLVNLYNQQTKKEDSSIKENSNVDYNDKEKELEMDIKKENNSSNKQVVKYVEIIGSRVNSRYSNSNNSSNSSNNSNNQKRVMLIKDVLAHEINELGMYLYVMMQNPDTKKKAIKAWDILENMAYKPANDKKALEKIVRVLSKVSSEHPEIVTVDNKKIVKLLDK